MKSAMLVILQVLVCTHLTELFDETCLPKVCLLVKLQQKSLVLLKPFLPVKK